MSIAAISPVPGLPSGTSPAAIRAALLPEEVDEFDADYRHALDVARETLNLTELIETLESWRRVAQSTQADPAAHRRMLQAAKSTARTGEPPAGSRSWSDLKADLGL